MTLKEWLSFGGNEVANNARAFGYARTAGCAGWIVRAGCPTLQAALGDQPYTYENISLAPWYDSTIADVSSRFFGVYVLDIAGLMDSTREAQVVQSAGSGGQIGTMRRGTKETRVRAFLLARGSDAMEYGRAWLDRVLSPGACGQHGVSCGVTDAMVLTTCPPARDGYTDEEYDALLAPLERFIHDAAVTSGPFLVEEASDGHIFSETVEWTITSERPWIYGRARALELPSVPSTVVADVPVNLARYPSAEVDSGTVLLATNLNTNPSVETNTTGWGVGTTIISGADVSPYRTGQASTTKAGNGTTSYLGRILGNGSTEANGRTRLFVRSDTTIAPATGQRFSAGLWIACNILAGGTSSVIHEVHAYLEWLDSGGTVISGTSVIFATMDPADYTNGAYYSVSGLQAPAGAVTARLQARADVTWRSSATPANNSDIRLYADMATLTTP